MIRHRVKERTREEDGLASATEGGVGEGVFDGRVGVFGHDGGDGEAVSIGKTSGVGQHDRRNE